MKPNHYSKPGPIGNTQGIIVPQTSLNASGANNPAPEPQPEEETKGWWKSWGSSLVHGALDVVGFIPGVGTVAEGLNAAIYTAEGDYVNAALSAAAMVPIGGKAVKTGTTISKKAAEKLAKEAAEKAAKKAAIEKAKKEAAEKAAKEKAEREAAEKAAKKNKDTGGYVNKKENTFKDQASLDSHYNKHASEFGDITKDQYLKGAQDLTNSKPGGDILTKTRPNGDTLYYNKLANEFSVKAADGTIRTYFKPTDGIKYFNKQ